MQIRSLHWINLWRFVAKLQPGNKRSRPLTHFNFLLLFFFSFFRLFRMCNDTIYSGSFSFHHYNSKQHLANILCILLLFSWCFFGSTRFLLMWSTFECILLAFWWCNFRETKFISIDRIWMDAVLIGHMLFIYRLRVQHAVVHFFYSLECSVSLQHITWRLYKCQVWLFSLLVFRLPFGLLFQCNLSCGMNKCQAVLKIEEREREKREEKLTITVTCVDSPLDGERISLTEWIRAQMIYFHIKRCDVCLSPDFCVRCLCFFLLHQTHFHTHTFHAVWINAIFSVN